MICKFCGKTIETDSAFCNGCGKNQEENITPKEEVKRCKTCGKELSQNSVKSLCDYCEELSYRPVPTTHYKKPSNKPLIISFIFVAVLIGFIVIGGYANDTAHIATADIDTLQDTTSSSEESTITPEIQDDGYITYSKYEKANIGMTYSKICKVIGSTGTEVSRATAKNEEIITYVWLDKDKTGANGTFIFKNNKLVSKAQFLL